MTKPISLRKYDSYTRREVHDIFDPLSAFIPQRGTWGFQGIVKVPDREGDFVFFVTYGRKENHHTFDEEVTTEGVFSWQSQPKQGLDSKTIQTLINHDHERNNIYLFLRTDGRIQSYTYLGKLAYISHDPFREEPVYFKWQILDWELEQEEAKKFGLLLARPTSDNNISRRNQLTQTPPPEKDDESKNKQLSFQGRKINHEENNKRNKALGKLGEELVLAYEKEQLVAAGRKDLADQVEHTSFIIGDGTGYDIKSFNPDGQFKYIEVKTTTGGEYTDFYITLRELLFSEENAQRYYLYRVYEYDADDNSGFFYILRGGLKEIVNLTPTQFRASLK